MIRKYKSFVLNIVFCYFRNILLFIRNYRLISFFSLIFLCGVTTGALLNISFITDEWTSTLSEFLSSRHYATFFSFFKASFSPIFLLLFIVFLSGFFVFGSFISPLFPFIRGLGIGIAIGQLIITYSIKGIAIWFFTMLPGIFISSFVMIFGCSISFSFSQKLFAQLKVGTYTLNYNIECKRYLTVYSVLLVITAASSALDALLACLFSTIIVI